MKKNKKTKYYQKDKVKQELTQLETDYVNKLQDAKNTCKIGLADLKQEPDKSNLKAKIKALKEKYLVEKSEIKEWYKKEKVKIKEDNFISLDQEQLDQIKAKELFESSKFRRFFGRIALNKNQKAILKEMIKKQDELLNNINEKFDPKNVFETNHFNFFYGNVQALFDINIKIKRKKVTTFIGPSGCGKSTFLKCLNRMNDQVPGSHFDGSIYFNDGTNLYSKNLNPLILTTKVGMVFQKATPFPMSIYDNIAYGPRSHGILQKDLLDKIVKESLQSAALWDEVSHKLFSPATALSGGQQQRLCIARAIALKPEVLLMDESTSGLDPIATAKIENLILELKEHYTIILVTHSMAQVQRVSDYTAFFYKGHLIEYDETRKIFFKPKNKKTRDYISGKIG
ncbi:MAG: phosphate ABC transporter ATP-binding protein [Mycoplasma sp.]|nr:phosphate ABC transporter ATP-binding protein [Mycoplasma sp.]